MPKCPNCESKITSLIENCVKRTRSALQGRELIKIAGWDSTFYHCPVCEDVICQTKEQALNWLLEEIKDAN